MANKYKFSDAERFGVWHAFDSKCFWCGEILDFTHTTIDHVIPEIYEEKPEELARIKTEYALEENYQINDFCNWVPAHAKCNSQKNDALFRRSPAFIRVLHFVSQRAPIARRKAKQIEREAAKSNLLAKLGSAMEQGNISYEELVAFAAIFQRAPEEPAPKEQTTFQLSPQFRVIHAQDNLLYVSDGKNTGYIPATAANLSWLCPNCLSYGPWSGATCLTCGVRSTPD